MFDSPKAAYFAALDSSGRPLHYANQRGLDARWLAAKFADAAGVDFLAAPTVESVAAIMLACAKASAATGLRVVVDAAEVEFMRKRAELDRYSTPFFKADFAGVS